MITPFNSWKRLKRNVLYDTKFLTLYSDTVEVKPDVVLEDFSSVKIRDGVMVVATDEQGKIIAFHEYKYPSDMTFLGLPAGTVDEGESPLEAAARELLEETGYESTELEYIAGLHPFPSKVIHTSHIVRAKNARKVADIMHEEAETISEVILIDPNDIAAMQEAGDINTTYILATFALTHPEYLRRV